MSWLSLELYRHGMIKIGRFKLSSGIESPFYIDLRKLYSYPKLRERVVDELLAKVPINSVDIVVGVATAGIALASLIACRSGKPMAYVRLERKEHGLGGLVEGEVGGMRSAIIDDVATTGESIERAYRALIEAGSLPLMAVVVVDREQGAMERVERLGIKLYKLVTAREIFEHLYLAGVINRDTYDSAIEYLRRFKSGAQ